MCSIAWRAVLASIAQAALRTRALRAPLGKFRPLLESPCVSPAAPASSRGRHGRRNVKSAPKGGRPLQVPMSAACACQGRTTRPLMSSATKTAALAQLGLDAISPASACTTWSSSQVTGVRPIIPACCLRVTERSRRDRRPRRVTPLRGSPAVKAGAILQTIVLQIIQAHCAIPATRLC